MNSKGKYIGLNQRIPFDVMDSSIHYFLMNGIIDKGFVLQRMQEFTSGINRAAKATSYVVQILNRQIHLLKQLKTVLKETPYYSVRQDDRKAICLCLISLTYPITYDLLIALAQGFKVQNQINKMFITEKVMSIYGSNRTVDIAIDALIPMIIELQTIKRDKVSLYSLGDKLSVTNKFVSELVIYTDIKLSGSKTILIDDLVHKPWFSYFELPSVKPDQFNQLISKKDSAVGKGYLTI
ncbi:MAG: hypothetical protein NTU44_10900 [Bacteroidetes bacterium]|nr:hypothetical protein [Bacteroidota bacterium]